MILEIQKTELIAQIKKQLDSLFLISEEELSQIELNIDRVLERTEYCFARTKNKYYSKNGEVYFNPFHSGQYTIFLYYLANTIYQKSNAARLADKVYFLNKTLNGCDLFYEIELPSVFMLDHPVGSVMGRAKYGEYFQFGQNCTVGNNKGIFPVISNNVQMTANSMIIGNCLIGENSIIGAGACVKDENIPANSLVFGQSPNLIIKTRGSENVMCYSGQRG